MRLAAVLDSEALETAAREQWKDIHISLSKVVDLSKVQKAWEELNREPNTDLIALACCYLGSQAAQAAQVCCQAGLLPSRASRRSRAACACTK
jgi:rhodanese-related sulfurtransferase